MTRIDQGLDISSGGGSAIAGAGSGASAGASSSSLTDAGQQQSQRQQDYAEQINVGSTERAASVAGGAILALFGVKRGGLAGLVTTALGGALLHRGVTGHCHLNQALGIDTTDDTQHTHGIHIEQAFLINRSPEELYTFWRDFRNLPRIMTHLQRVDVIDDRRSHWVARLPNFGGKQLEWDAEITAEEPNRMIAWRSLESADVHNSGAIRFAPALGERGTEVHVFMDYIPPAGVLGNWIAKLFGENPSRVIREDLRNFKRLMEIGEILTIIGQPHGTCTGQSERYTESEWRPLFT
ncbi:MAG TPA: SRPBCC family protein [Tepidisphaeraceae bacterium]|nr:SRPBCC family protein [Tepidisphaeraceae bacterium]